MPLGAVSVRIRQPRVKDNEFCPDRYTKDHRACSRCDKEFMMQYGYASVANLVGEERAAFAREELRREGIIR